ncbi:protein ADM2a [Triplophysa dalaica]|uniref:protein ADM2a n=1 Tax=Triplophysa dalaica TaxID=1582913 RepID=UPI0024DFF093|nr:protein ADM2a [Triplophysa dalaica]
MRALFALVYCISLLSSQLLALPVKSQLRKNRLDFMLRLRQLTAAGAISPDITDRPVSIDRTILWRAILSRPPPPALDNPTEIHTSQPMGIESNEVSGVPQQRGSRGRRHVRSHHSHHHPQLMRVGCVLGTCQVQNLSHRLYQLSGQSGREDSSPINPRSPHSYG